MNIKTFEKDIEAIIEKFYLCETFMQKGEKGEDEVVVDLTVQTPDREKDIMLVSGARLEDYQENPIIQADHNFSVRSTVGSCKWIKKQGDRIRFSPRFASTTFGQEVKTLVMEGHLKSVSHTFRGWGFADEIPDMKSILHKYNIEADAENLHRIYVDWEPIEISWVVAGMHKDAVAQLVSKGLIKTKGLIDSLQIPLEEYLEKRNKQEKIKVFYKKGILYYTEEKPFKNFHSCRLEDPDKYRDWGYEECGEKHDGKCIDHVYGVLAPNKSEIQALRYSTKIWEISAARSHCKDRKGSFEAAEKSEDNNKKDNICCAINQTFKSDKYAQVLNSSGDKSVQVDKYAAGEQGIEKENKLAVGIDEVFKTYKSPKGGE